MNLHIVLMNYLLKKRNMSNQELAKGLHKPIITKFQVWKVHSLLKDIFCSADLADRQLINKFNKIIRLSLRVIDIYSKSTRANPLKDKEGITITDAFQNISR